MYIASNASIPSASRCPFGEPMRSLRTRALGSRGSGLSHGAAVIVGPFTVVVGLYPMTGPLTVVVGWMPVTPPFTVVVGRTETI